MTFSPYESQYQHVPGKPKNEKGTISCIVDIFTIQEGKISQYRQCTGNRFTEQGILLSKQVFHKPRVDMLRSTIRCSREASCSNNHFLCPQQFLDRVPYYSVSELRSLNRVRLSLQVYSMACITTAHAGSLRDGVRSRRHSVHLPRSTLSWPYAKATAHDWAVWKRCVRETMGAPHLPRQLGPWRCTHQIWRSSPPAITITQYLRTFTATWNIQVEGMEETTKSITELQQHVHGPPLQAYLRHKLDWTQDDINGTNWEAFQRVMERYPLHLRTTRMKAIYGWLNTNQWKERIYCTSPVCPLCNETDTNDHVLICPTTVEDRREAVTKFIDTIKGGTPLDLQNLFRRRLCDALHIPLYHDTLDIVTPRV